MTCQIIYSPESLDDLRAIYSYIAFEKFAPENAENQVNRIRNNIRSLDLFPEGHTIVDWDPWASMGMRFLPVDNYIVYYLVDDNEGTSPHNSPHVVYHMWGVMFCSCRECAQVQY